MTLEMVGALVLAFFNSFQVRGIVALIFLDLLLGMAAALKVGVFSWQKVAQFYVTSVLPYVIGYGALYVTVYLIVPPNFGIVSDSLVTIAWGALVATLVGSVWKSLRELYPQVPDLPMNAPAKP